MEKEWYLVDRRSEVQNTTARLPQCYERWEEMGASSVVGLMTNYQCASTTYLPNLIVSRHNHTIRTPTWVWSWFISVSQNKVMRVLGRVNNISTGFGSNLYHLLLLPLTEIDIITTHTSLGLMSLILGGQVQRDSKPLDLAAQLLIHSDMENGDFCQQEIMVVFMRNCSMQGIFSLCGL